MGTWLDEGRGTETLYEEGGVYDRKPRCKFADLSRELKPGEPTTVCCRCGQRFVAINGETAESWRDLHVTGDGDSPSICTGEGPVTAIERPVSL